MTQFQSRSNGQKCMCGVESALNKTAYLYLTLQLEGGRLQVSRFGLVGTLHHDTSQPYS